MEFLSEYQKQPIVNCDREDCRIVLEESHQTNMYFPPVYDKFGNNLNPDKNKTTKNFSCSTCNKKWSTVT